MSASQSFTETEVEVDTLLTTGVQTSTQNVTGSKFLMKVLTSVALSAVPYYRKLLPESSFYVHSVRGMTIPYIKDSSTCADSSMFYKLIESIRDGLDKEYLEEVTINIYEDGDVSQTLIESYNYKYNYDAETSVNTGGLKRFDSKFILEKVIKLLQVSKLRLSDMPPVPKDWKMGIYIKYTDNAPIDYISQGFEPCDTIPDAKKEYILKLGQVTTPYHQLKIYQHSDNFRDYMIRNKKMLKDDKNMPNYDNIGDVMMSQESLKDLFTEPNLVTNPAVEANENLNTKMKKNKKLSLKKTFFDHEDDNETSNLRCPCKRRFSSSTFVIITCMCCHYAQHAECFGILIKNKDAKFDHICDICAVRNGDLICTDPGLIKLSAVNKKSLCLFRTTLASYDYYREIDVQLLTTILHISENVAEELFQRSIQMGIFQNRMTDMNDEIQTKIVDTNILHRIIPTFFHKILLNPLVPSLTPLHFENLNIEDDDDIMATPNVITKSLDYSPIKISNDTVSTTTNLHKEQDCNTSMESSTSRRSTRIRKLTQKYSDPANFEPLPKKPKGGQKTFKKQC